MKPLEIPTAYDQKIWDEKIHNICHKILLDRMSTDKDQARLLALQEKESGAKKSKYVTVETYNNYHFVPIAIETLGPWGDDAKKIINEIGQKIQKITNESRSTSYLSQRISIAVQRGNAASVLGTIHCGIK
jgi:hypothetical protein